VRVSDHGRSKSAKEAWTEQQFIRAPSSCNCEEEDVEELSDVPVDVPQQDEAQKVGYQGTNRPQAEEEEPEALAQSSAPRMQQPCPRYPTDGGRLLRGGGGWSW